MIATHDITGLLLAGGEGSRMGGLDKGMQIFRGKPLAQHALERLQAQTASVLINANRNLSQYAAWGPPVWPDELPLSNTEEHYAGPLAGFLTGLRHCGTPYMVTVPCDTPLFPTDLVNRLATALYEATADIAMVSAPEMDSQGVRQMHRQPVFCLMRSSLLESLTAFTHSGGRKIAQWAGQHALVHVPFDQPHDDPRAFFNANTLAELQELERL